MRDFLAMHIKAKSFYHQQMAFDFACNKYGITTPCKNEAATLWEHDWYAMISNLFVFSGGAEVIHQYSTPYPGYSEAVTNKKINHFLESGKKLMFCSVLQKKGLSVQEFEVKTEDGTPTKL